MRCLGELPPAPTPGAEPWEGEGAGLAGAMHASESRPKKQAGESRSSRQNRPARTPRRGRPGGCRSRSPDRGRATRTCGEAGPAPAKRRAAGLGQAGSAQPGGAGLTPPLSPEAGSWVRGAGARSPAARQVKPSAESIPQPPQELCEAAQEQRVFKHRPLRL